MLKKKKNRIYSGFDMSTMVGFEAIEDIDTGRVLVHDTIIPVCKKNYNDK
jgi:hypothetical protein